MSAQEAAEVLRNHHLYCTARDGRFEQIAAMLEAKEAEIVRLREDILQHVEETVSAWAFAHDIDGASRNILFTYLRAALSSGEPKP